MKKYLLIAAVALPLTTQAVCFKAFPVSGYGIEELEENAKKMCGADDFNWTQRMSEYIYSDGKVTAQYRCCSAW